MRRSIASLVQAALLAPSAFGQLYTVDVKTKKIVRLSPVFVESSWTEALERAAEGLREARDSGGVGVLPGGRNGVLLHHDDHLVEPPVRTR